ncbi:GNAT family N-acetyltransferase (MarR-family transcriptional regulator) [Colletotrichum tofieldiae]|uniref:GNAT family N-acetyltransferase (MarR-family transcriptional regulator) n=1 Tax=Colletotrichum tofieldiae TaxID=708197 RepID=A0A166QN79_9PEZI|nr:GNAT family N-acetyltransferase (MarR-family transcriptional regulator) [Colletotrichum tofieldiae]GKT86085.1 GNAT family N-acetyltransferase [Colletotrichum tofieldiae]
MEEPSKISISGDIEIRGHRAGDMGYITYRHAAIYSKEFGYNEHFEALVGRITSDFLCNYDPVMERCWIAERDGEFLGCIMLVKELKTPSKARLRCFLVEEGARGSGLGTILIKLCIDMAKEVGYEHIVLSTSSLLGSARRLYTRFGFQLKVTKEHQNWGEKQVGETWEMKL